MPQTLKPRKNYGAIDIAKFILAVLVVFSHTRIFMEIENSILENTFTACCHLAVPFFLIASGYLIFEKFSPDLKDPANLKFLSSFAKKTAILYLTWTAIYIPITIYGVFENDYSIKRTAWEIFRGLVFSGEQFYSWAFWYLLACAVAAIIIRELFKRGVSLNKLLIISILLFFVGKFFADASYIQINPTIDKIVDYYFKIFGTAKNGPFYALLYLTIGMLISKHKPKINKFLFTALVLINFVICYIKDFDSLHFSIFITFLSSLLFIFCLNKEVKVTGFHFFCRLASKVVFYTHMIFLFLFSFIFPLRDILSFYPIFFRGAIITAITIVISIIVYFLQKHNKCKFLKKIF